MRNNGQWTEARFNSFIKSGLRALSNRWGPKYTCKKEARGERGMYKCAGYNKKAHIVPASIPPKTGKKRINNVLVDHISPVIDPKTGFQSWDETVSRMFCEKEGLQVLCKECHDTKTKDEKETAKNARKIRI